MKEKYDPFIPCSTNGSISPLLNSPEKVDILGSLKIGLNEEGKIQYFDYLLCPANNMVNYIEKENEI